MSLQPTSFACDVCGKRRDNDVNRWWSLMILAEGIEVQHWTTFANNFPTHACGQACGLVLVARYMDHGDFTDGVKGTKSENMLAGRERM